MGLKVSVRVAVEQLEDILSLLQNQRGRAAGGVVDMRRYQGEAMDLFRKLQGVRNGLSAALSPPEKPAAEKPAAEKPAAEKPAAEKPTHNRSA